MNPQRTRLTPRAERTPAAGCSLRAGESWKVMPRKSVLIHSVAAGLFVAVACSSDEPSTPNEESNNPGDTPGAGTDARTGSIQFALQVASGVEVDTINYQISGPGMSTMTGSMDAGDG